MPHHDPPSPFRQRAVLCVVCSRWVANVIEILDELCLDCYLKGWRPTFVTVLGLEPERGEARAEDPEPARPDWRAVLRRWA
jgi:hypothetical protein